MFVRLAFRNSTYRRAAEFNFSAGNSGIAVIFDLEDLSQSSTSKPKRNAAIKIPALSHQQSSPTPIRSERYANVELSPLEVCHVILRAEETFLQAAREDFKCEARPLSHYPSIQTLGRALGNIISFINETSVELESEKPTRSHREVK